MRIPLPFRLQGPDSMPRSSLATPASLLAQAGLLLLSLLSILPDHARGEAETLRQGDMSFMLYEAMEPYNRFWYFNDSPTGCTYADGSKGPCSRFSPAGYDSLEVPMIGGERATMEDVFLSSTGLRAEVGLLDGLTLSAETQLVARNAKEGNPLLVLGDSRLGARYRFSDGPVLISFGSALKLPGAYRPIDFWSPGGGQTDLEVKALMGGLAMRRRLFYDFGFGYRFRFPYKAPAFITVEPNGVDCTATVDAEGCETYATTGPADEVFVDLSIGYFTNRFLLLYANLSLVNSTKGRSIDDFFIVSQRAASGDYTVSGNIGNLLSDLEEDYARLGVGAMLKPFPSATFYLNYSYIVLGRNTLAFYVIPETSIPVGALSLGFEYIFEAWNKTVKPSSGQAKRSSSPNEVLTRRYARP